jgi:signal transduction histidine kinase
VTNRILLALLAFTAAVLVGAVVPLTLDATNHDRSSFIQDTLESARTDAAVAQARLDGGADLALYFVLNQAAEAGDGLLILRIVHGNLVQVTEEGMPAGGWRKLAAEADGQDQAITETTGSRVVAAVPVFNQGNQQLPLVGTVILARSAAPLNRDIRTLWVVFGGVSVAAMIAAVLIAFGLARWVNRPLAGLDSAARRLADGDLAIRAATGSGPPELRRLARTFNTMAGRLEALVHGNRAVIADVSHQLRTPLAALRLRLDLLAADADPLTAAELAGALDELARLSRLVDGLLAVARAENVVSVPVTVDVAEAASERVAAWHPVADDRGILLADTRPAGRVLAWLGEGHLEQILDNLIANALDALSPGDRLRVTATQTPDGARVTVADNGPGMSAEDRARAFLRFSTSNPNGTGLGLAIVHRLATSNGGRARLDPTPGGGLTVTLDFPVVPAANGAAGTDPKTPGDPPAGGALPVGKHQDL